MIVVSISQNINNVWFSRARIKGNSVTKVGYSLDDVRIKMELELISKRVNMGDVLWEPPFIHRSIRP